MGFNGLVGLQRAQYFFLGGGGMLRNVFTFLFVPVSVISTVFWLLSQSGGEFTLLLVILMPAVLMAFIFMASMRILIRDISFQK